MFELVQRAHRDVEFTVVSATLDPRLREHVRWRKVPIIRRPFIVKFLMFFVLSGFRYRRRGSLVHSLGAILPRRVDVMAVHFCHAAFRADTAPLDLEADQPRWRRLNIALALQMGLLTERLLTRPPWAKRATAVSSGGAQELSRFYPTLPVVVIPNGVDHARFAPSADARRVAREEQAVASDHVVVLFVGGRWSQKGLEAAIRGFGVASARTTASMSMWVAGSGDVPLYEAIAASAGVDDRVRFLGYRDDAERLYQAADIFLLPSAYETFCMVAYEAASCGLPVVATAVNGIDDLVQGDRAGRTIAASAESVGAALAELAADESLRTALGARGREAASRLTWDATVAATIDLYDDLLPTL